MIDKRLAIPAFVSVALATTAAATLSAAQRDDLSAEDRARVAAVTAPPGDFSEPEPFERMQAGAATSTKRVNANVFSNPTANLPFEEQERFALGNGLFRKDWVSAPSSTQASDGLGPLFNARACQSCHIKDGRGHAPASPDDGAVSLLVRLSLPPEESDRAAIEAGTLVARPHPAYGLQLQDFAVAGVKAEGRVRIDYEDVEVSLAGGETVTLRKPLLAIEDEGYGPLGEDVMLSARVAPPMIGLGLLEAIHPADILAKADPEDRDGDGISGRPHFVIDRGGETVIGRFGWKALEPTVSQQTAHAFSGDMGLSTPFAPAYSGECMPAQSGCLKAPAGAQARLGEHEVPGELLDLVVFYSENLAVPARRNEGDEDVLAGKRLFHEAGCATCHTPKFVTSREAANPAHRFQLIWPHTDLLLHDMGDGLADNRAEGHATGREWRTPPLWGIGLTKTVNGEATFLHDGRARTLLEAVLWHGGEAEAARERVVAMEKSERDALIRFLESL